MTQPVVLLIIGLLLWAGAGHWLFLRYIRSSFVAKAWVEYAMFFLSGPVTWVRFRKLLK